ncbi:MAG: extracellular solute-binding protein [Clostridiales bacterium]|nr:extracellular solute-binding protein [Clostridiales bacterium]
MKKPASRFIAFLIVMAMLLPIAACKPKDEDKTVVISADDPYFSVMEVDIYQAKNQYDSVSYNVIQLGDQVGILLDIYEYDDEYMEMIEYEQKMYDAEMEAYDVGEFEGDSEGDLVPDETDGEEIDPDDEPIGPDGEDTDETIDPDDEEWDEIIEPDDEDPSYPDEMINNQKRLLYVYDLEGERVGEADLTELFDDSSYVQSIKGDGRGNIAMIVESYDPQSWESIQLMVIIDPSGNEIQRTELKLDQNTWVNSFVFDEQGNIYISAYGETGASVTVSDDRGNKIFSIEEEHLGGTLYSIDGTVYVDSYGTGDAFEYMFYPIDLEARKLGEPIDVMGLQMGSPSFSENGVYLNKPGGIYSYDLKTGEESPILSWNDTDLDMSKYMYASCIPFSDEKVVMISQNYYLMEESEEPEPVTMVVLTKEKTNPNAGKKVLQLGGFGLMYDPELTAEVYRYNKTNQEFRVVLKDYYDLIDLSEVASGDEADMMKVLANVNEQIYLDMINGDGPDILMSGYMINSLERFEAKGLLADLYEIAKKDESFDKEDYIQSVLALFEQDGKLYQFPTGFSIYGLVGPTRLIGERNGWTVDEFNEMVNNLPEGVYTLVNITQSELLSSCIASSMNTFVDYSENEVRLDTPDFYKLLEFAKTYGSEDVEQNNEPRPMYDDMYYDETYIDEWELMSQGKLALATASLYGPSDLSNYRFNFGEPVSFVGYPSGDKAGLACAANQKFAISEESANKDEAWSFIRHFISEEVQTQKAMYSEAPIHRGALDAKIEQLLNPPKDENEFDDRYYDDSRLYGEQPTQEDVDQYLALIDSLSTLQGEDEQILSIILEETPAFFKGLKSAEDVAAIIQDRVKTYVSERS